MSFQPGRSNLNNSSALPWPAFTSTVAKRSNSVRAEATFWELFSFSLMNFSTDSRPNTSGSALAMAPSMRTSVWSSL